MDPAHARDEQHRREGGRVDECGADVGLNEHEHDRRRAEPDRRERHVDLVHPAGAVGEEAGEE